MASSILVVGARSAGHILPARAYAQQLCEQHGYSSIRFITSTAPLDIRLVQTDENVRVTRYNLPPVPTGTRSTLWYIRCAVWIMWCAWYTIRTLGLCIVSRPRAVVSTGGYLTLPVWYAAYILRIPRYLYELNVVPGAATKHLARLSTVVYCCFPQTCRSFSSHVRTACVDYPVAYHPDKVPSRALLRASRGISDETCVVVVLGGSQGAQALNTIVGHALHDAGISQSCTVFHQAGRGHSEETQQIYRQYGITAQVVEYTEHVGHWLAMADLVIARAGAGTLFELAAFGCRAFIIPLRAATTTHQTDNACAMQALYPGRITVLNDERQLTAELSQWFFASAFAPSSSRASNYESAH